MFYLVTDSMTCWGAGQTIDEAKTEACRWLCNADGVQGITSDELEAMLITEYESRNGADGVFIYAVRAFDWPSNSSELDGDGWLKYFWAQEKLNS